LNNELVVHADLAELIFDNGDFFAVFFGKNMVQERGFSGAKKAGDDGYGDAIGDVNVQVSVRGKGLTPARRF
jgi:hypothetical protein